MIACFLAGLYLPVLYGVVKEGDVISPSDVKRTLERMWAYYIRIDENVAVELQKIKLVMAFLLLPAVWFYMALIYWTFDKMGTTIILAGKMILKGFLSLVGFFTWMAEEVSWRVRFRRQTGVHEVNDPYNTLECMREGSPLIKKDPPPYQMIVWHEGGAVSGGAVRMEDYLVTPAHVLPDLSRVLVSKTIDSTIHLVKPEKVYTLTTDLVALRLSATAWARLQISKAKARPLETTVLVSIVGPLSDKNATTGNLKDIDVLGMVGYQGSTVPGFSGCAYTCNNMFLGIHRAGGRSGRVNTGFSALYVKALLEYATVDEVMESTGDSGEYLASLTRADEEPLMNQFHTGDYMVKSKGKYYVLSEDQVEDLKNRRARTLAFDDTLGTRAAKSAKEVKEFIARKRERGELVWADEESDEEESQTLQESNIPEEDQDHFLGSGAREPEPGPSRVTRPNPPATVLSKDTSQSSQSLKKQLKPTATPVAVLVQTRKKNKKVSFSKQSTGPNSTSEDKLNRNLPKSSTS